jgi:hypothetical protein
VSLKACGAICSGLTGKQVRYAEDRGTLSLVIHVSLSRAASFLGPHSRRGQHASGHFGQARLSKAHCRQLCLPPTITSRRVLQPLTEPAFRARHHYDRRSSFTLSQQKQHELRNEALRRLQRCLTRVVMLGKVSQMMRSAVRLHQ